MKNLLIFAILFMAANCGPFGCAPSFTHLEKHLEKGDFEKALEMVADDPSGQVELAALILERAASKGVQTSELIGVLKSAGSPGERALKRLTEKATDPAKSLAKIAIMGKHPPKGKERLQYLEHDHSDVRAGAICAWNNDLTLNRLALMILDADHRVRRCAVEGIRSLGAKDEDLAHKLLGDALRLDPEATVRGAAAKAGKLLGEDAYLKLKIALEDENMGVRLSALQGLSDIGNDAAIAALEDLSAGPMDELVIAAASELSRLGHEMGQRKLLEALDDSRPGIREAALLRTERARISNRDELFLAALDDEAPKVVLLAASSLSKKEAFAAAAVEALKKIADSGLTTSDEARDLLTLQGDRESVTKVKKVLETAGTDEALGILSRVKRCGALTPVFVKLMADFREPIRIAASSAVLASTKDRH